jgi:tetratricopeptide (TPR) repeat protein
MGPGDVTLSDLLRAVKGGRRAPTTVDFFRRARRYRDEGRFEEAGELVARGLALDPDSVVGHMLAGSLHAALREMDHARAAFRRVLAIDPVHPRALLGLSRIALEEGDTATCTQLLHRALGRYPEFPEAQALLEVVGTGTPTPPDRPPPQPLRAERLRIPSESREVLVLHPDATVLAAQPRGAGTDERAARTARLCRLASAMLSRSGLGTLQRAVVEGAAETTLIRGDAEVLLSMTISRDVETGVGLGHLDRLWSNCQHELRREPS